ncbi:MULTISPECIES: helix-turn-helix domain-containing protein [Olivibacter]|uniref:Helix-turn-helix domain-containing protein n=1 Tax=Olivibacter jilunii TaxID=985016 RepID=A0ABW6AV41_9SPHI
MLVVNNKEEFKHLLIESLLEAGLIHEAKPVSTESKQQEIIDNLTLMSRLNISQPTLRQWRNKGKIRFMKIGGCYRYNWKHVLEDLERKGA